MLPNTPAAPPSKREVRSEGQRLLIALDAKNVEIAEQLSVSKVSVGEWRNGLKKPGPDVRRHMLAHYQIAPAAWDQLPHVRAVAELPAEPAPEVQAPPEPGRRMVKPRPPIELAGVGDPLAEVADLIRQCRIGMKTAGLVASEQANWQDRLLKALQHQQKLQDSADVRDDKIVRNAPFWLRIKDTLGVALEPYPEAARAVAKALRELDE